MFRQIDELQSLLLELLFPSSDALFCSDPILFQHGLKLVDLISEFAFLSFIPVGILRHLVQFSFAFDLLIDTEPYAGLFEFENFA